jgi:hypothetical protein
MRMDLRDGHAHCKAGRKLCALRQVDHCKAHQQELHPHGRIHRAVARYIHCQHDTLFVQNHHQKQSSGAANVSITQHPVGLLVRLVLIIS